MSVTLLVLNLSPKFIVVIALRPQFKNINDMSPTYLVLKLIPKSNPVIAVVPQFLNIPCIAVDLVTFNKSILYITLVSLHFELDPI